MIRRNIMKETSGEVFAGVTPKEVFGMDDFTNSIIPNDDTGRFEKTISGEEFKQNDPKAANTDGIEIGQTPGIEGDTKLEGKSIDLQAGLDAVMECLAEPGAPEPGQSFSESGLSEIENILSGGK